MVDILRMWNCRRAVGEGGSSAAATKNNQSVCVKQRLTGIPKSAFCSLQDDLYHWAVVWLWLNLCSSEVEEGGNSLH